VGRGEKVFLLLFPFNIKQWNLSRATKQWNLSRATKQWNLSGATKQWNLPWATKHWSLPLITELESSFTSFFLIFFKGQIWII
jgi:hypothetical protein